MCLASEWQKIFDSIASFIYTPSVITNSRFIDFNIPQATFKNYDSFVSMLQQKVVLNLILTVIVQLILAFVLATL